MSKFAEWIKAKRRRNNYAIIVGHSSDSMGARNRASNIYEYEYNDMLAQRILDIYTDQYLHTGSKEMRLSDCFNLDIIYRNKYKDLPSMINKKKYVAAVSLHCNAFNEEASGTEVLYKKDCETSRNLAKLTLNVALDTLNLRNRGVKQIDEEDKGGYLLYNCKSPVVILESFFIDNDTDLDTGAENIYELAENILYLFLLLNKQDKGVIYNANDRKR